MIGPQSIIVVRRASAAADRYGDVHPTGTATRTIVNRCTIVPRSSSENNGTARAAVIVGVTVYAPPSADIRADDQVEIGGLVYDVDGEPGVWVNTLGRVRGLEVALRRAAG